MKLRYLSFLAVIAAMFVSGGAFAGPGKGECIRDLRIRKIAPPVEAKGASFSYVIQLMNAGTCDELNFSLQDQLPEHVLYVSAIPVPSSAPTVIHDGAVLWSGLNLLAGNSAIFQINVTENSGTSTADSLVNTACVYNSSRICDTAITSVPAPAHLDE